MGQISFASSPLRSCIVLATADFALTDLITLPALLTLQKTLASKQVKYLNDIIWVNNLLVDYAEDTQHAKATLFPNVPDNDPIKIAACEEHARTKMANTVATQMFQMGDKAYEFMVYYFGNSPKVTKSRIDNIYDLLVIQQYLTKYQLQVVTDLISLMETKGKLTDDEMTAALQTYSRRALWQMKLPKNARLDASTTKNRLQGFVRERVEHFSSSEQVPQFAREFSLRQIENHDLFVGYFPMPPLWLDYLYLVEVGIREAK
jgi:hypothetical protein